jgi:hypothetical protein
MADRFDDILNECTERLLRGESVEQCLQRYPEQGPELKPLLRVAAAAGKASSAVDPRPEFRARTRYEVQSRLRSKEWKVERKGTPALRWMPRWAMVAACLALLLVFAGGGTVAASSGSVPGDTLYAVKTTAEGIQLKLTFSDAGKARLQAKFAERRVWEMAQLARKGRTEALQALSRKFESHLDQIGQLAAQMQNADPEDREQVAELNQVLNRNMARDLAVLDKAEATAPERGRLAIAVARFRLTQRYGELITDLDELENQQEAQSGYSAGPGSDGQQSGSGSLAGEPVDPEQSQAAGEGAQTWVGPATTPQLGTQHAC